jgi:hypothetical protein
MSQSEYTPVSQDHAIMDKTLQEFVIMFSLNQREMVNKLVDFYPDTAKDLQKSLDSTRAMARMLRA